MDDCYSIPWLSILLCFNYRFIIFTLYGWIKSYYFLLQLHFHASFCLFPLLFHFQDDSGSVSGHQLPMVNVQTGRNNVLNRVTTQQDKWKRQVWAHLSAACDQSLTSLQLAGPRAAISNLQLNVELSSHKPNEIFMQLSFQKSKIFRRGGFEPVRLRLCWFVRCANFHKVAQVQLSGT